jgi:2'-5' RNA ligase
VSGPAVDRELTEIGLSGEKRGFSPHLTLARVNSPGPTRLEKARAAIEGRVFGSFHAANMVLYRSELQPAGRFIPHWPSRRCRNKVLPVSGILKVSSKN